MSENNEGKEVKKRIRFRYVLGAGFALFVVYQMGYSSGSRSTVESHHDIHSVVESSHAPIIVPVPQSEVVPLAKPQMAPVVPSAPARVIETVSNPVVQNVASEKLAGYTGPPATNVPYPVSSNSVYERRLGLEKPSEVGLMPLRPLESIPEPLRIPAPVDVGRPSSTSQPAATYRPLSFIEVRSSSECDCGKEH